MLQSHKWINSEERFLKMSTTSASPIQCLLIYYPKGMCEGKSLQGGMDGCNGAVKN